MVLSIHRYYTWTYASSSIVPFFSYILSFGENKDFDTFWVWRPGILVKNMSESFFSCFDLKSWYIKYLKIVTRPSTEALPNACDKKPRPQLGICTGYQTTCAAFQISTVLGARTKTSLTEIECCYSSELSRISLNLVATAEQHFHTKLMQGSISQRLVRILSTRHCCRWLVLKTWSTLTDRVLKVRIRGKLNKVIGHQVLQ